ncbi:MAG: DUF2117 domain-containing protein [Methanosarcinaceae archaeon]|nr:DUF2117 domain-containing protein [Methanosarcinaceae archaeon]
MKIGIVVHGTELLDSGRAREFLTLLSGENRIRTCVCGTMGKIAAMDAGLEGEIDLGQHLKPSASIEAFFETEDLVCLLNHGKELDSGRAFGRIVVSHLENSEAKPLLQVERPGFSDGQVIPWNREAYGHAEKLAGLLGLKVASPPTPVRSVEVTDNGKRVLRRLSTRPGSCIMVNGIVVGKATSPDVALISENGFLILMEGGDIKKEGLLTLHEHEKRVPVDLAHAWVKTGKLWREKSRDKRPSCSNSCWEKALPGKKGRAVIIDHCAERSLELIEGASFAVTVGDDTTEIAGDILSRFGIPIIGITDGDCDELAVSAAYSPGSVVLLLKPGLDDEFGRRVKKELFSGKETAFFESLESLRQAVIKLAPPSLESLSEY